MKSFLRIEEKLFSFDTTGVLALQPATSPTAACKGASPHGFFFHIYIVLNRKKNASAPS